jgi:hypothetical protein
MVAILRLNNVKNTPVHICVNSKSGFFKHTPLHCLNFIEVEFIATVNHDYIKEKGELLSEFTYTKKYAEFTLLYFISHPPFSLSLLLFSLAAYSDEI